jgi:type IV pilus assembly protein PilY1
VVYAGSNLGVLHAFDLRTGEEIFGYVPRGVYPNLYRMATQDFQFTVDGEIRLFDAYNGSEWRQILVGTLGAGGRSIYALDVTDPESPIVLWELTADELEDPGHLGLTFAAAEPARLPSGDWVLLVGNGYHSESNEARLLMLDLFNGGNVLHNIRLGDAGTTAGPRNGLSTPRVAQDFSNRLTRSRWVYAGDLRGNLWRVELGESKTDSLDVKRLFQGDRPITMQPQTVYPAEGAGYLIAFGTGKFFENQDDNIIGAPTEYFYVINDTAAGGPGLTGLTRAGLANRTPGTPGEFDLYADGVTGWYVALDHGGRTGARALFTPDEMIGRVLFTSFRPDDNPCEVGGTTEVYMMNLRSGAGAFPSGGSYTPIVTTHSGAPTRAVFTTRPIIDTDTGEATAKAAISVGDRIIEIDDPEFDAAAMPRAYGERINWRQAR